jgi:hypothetical protein
MRGVAAAVTFGRRALAAGARLAAAGFPAPAGFLAAGGFAGVPVPAAGRAARLVLRRCGRVRGRLDMTSGVGSSGAMGAFSHRPLKACSPTPENR